MIVYKEKQYLVFDFENGKTVKYNFATNQCIGKKGKIVKSLSTQLSGITMEDIIQNCSDKNYAKFLKFVQNHYQYKINNIGTILSKIPNYKRFEQIYSAGIDNIIDSHFKYNINDIPKSLIKVCQQHNIIISNLFLEFWKQDIDAHYLAYQLDYVSLTVNDLYNIFVAYEHIPYGENKSYYNTLILEHGYNPKHLLLYIDYLKTYEALNRMETIIVELYDYVRMMSVISKKYDKYPRNFLTTHQIACRNYNRLKQEFSEALFKKQIKKKYNVSFGEYKFIYPETIQDIKDEAVQQNNCVASYIDKVIDGVCDIIFLRKKSELQKSLVTIEVRKNQIVQAKGRFNREVTFDEQTAIDKFNCKFLS